MAKIIW